MDRSVNVIQYVEGWWIDLSKVIEIIDEWWVNYCMLVEYVRIFEWMVNSDDVWMEMCVESDYIHDKLMTGWMSR